MRLPMMRSSSRKPGASMYRMTAGNWPGASGQAANAGWRPYLVLTVTSCSIICAASICGHGDALRCTLARFRRAAIEELPRARDQDVVDPDEVHEVLAHALAREVDPLDALPDGGLDLGVRRIARVTQRLREVEHPEAEIVDSWKRRDLARDVETALALDHDAQRERGIAGLHVGGPAANALAVLRATGAERAAAQRREI